MKKEKLTNAVVKFNKIKQNKDWNKYNLHDTFAKWNKIKSDKDLNDFIANTYQFTNYKEFYIWVQYSENKTFVDDRYCKYCGAYITEIWSDKKAKKHYYRPVCSEHNKQYIAEKRGSSIRKFYETLPEEEHLAHINKRREKAKATCRERYGDENFNNREKSKETCLEKYGVETALLSKEIREKIEKTNLDRYGCITPVGNKEIQEKIQNTNLKRYGSISPMGNPDITQKMINTTIKRHGGMGYGSEEIVEKIHATNKERYGDEIPFNCEEIIEKAKATNQEKYGVDYPLQSSEIHAKTIASGLANNSYYKGMLKSKATKFERYGDENYNNMESITASKAAWTDEKRTEIKTKRIETNNERYNSDYYNNLEQVKQTTLDRYGYENAFQVPEFKEKAKQTNLKRYGVESPGQSLEIREKANQTKKERGTFNTSKPEEDIKKLLLEKFSDTQYQYHSERYPWDCDFYIPELDLFIEYQGTWTHGFRPFNESIENLEILDRWKEKSKTSNFYKTAIDVWTIRDVKKRNWAKEHNLNWIEFFNFDEFMSWYNTL